MNTVTENIYMKYNVRARNKKTLKNGEWVKNLLCFCGPFDPFRVIGYKSQKKTGHSLNGSMILILVNNNKMIRIFSVVFSFFCPCKYNYFFSSSKMMSQEKCISSPGIRNT